MIKYTSTSPRVGLVRYEYKREVFCLGLSIYVWAKDWDNRDLANTWTLGAEKKCPWKLIAFWVGQVLLPQRLPNQSKISRHLLESSFSPGSPLLLCSSTTYLDLWRLSWSSRIQPKLLQELIKVKQESKVAIAYFLNLWREKNKLNSLGITMIWIVLKWIMRCRQFGMFWLCEVSCIEMS